MVTYTLKDFPIKTMYEVEYIQNEKDWERLCAENYGNREPWEFYKKREYDNLDDALTFYMAHFVDDKTFDIKLFEAIEIDGEIVREAYIEPSSCTRYYMRDLVNRDVNQRLSTMTNIITEQERTLSLYAEFIGKYNARQTFDDFVKTKRIEEI